MSVKDIYNLSFTYSFSEQFISLISDHLNPSIDKNELLQEQKRYLEFKDRFKIFKSVKLRSQAYRCYYLPILAKFTEQELSEHSVSIDTFVEWYVKFKKAYTSTKNIIEILKYYDTELAEKFSGYVNNDDNNDKILYKKCVKLGYTDSIKNMNISISKLHKDPSLMTFQEAISFSSNSRDNYILVSNKIILLEAKGYPDVKRINLEKERRTQRVEFLRKIASETKLRIKYVKEIDSSIDEGLESIKSMSVYDITKIIQRFTYKMKIMKVIEYILEDSFKFAEIENNLSYQYSKMNKVEFFFSNRPTDELKDLFDSVMSEYNIRLQNTSSYVDDRLKDKELRVVTFLEYIDKNHESSGNKDNVIDFLESSSSDDIDCILLKFGESCNYDNTKVKSKVSNHHQSLVSVTNAIWFLQKIGDKCSCHEYIQTLKCSYILRQIENKSELLNWDKRRVYTKEEIDSMISIVDHDTKDKLLITILREIGLRNAAICNLRIKDIIDEYNNPKHICRVKEKGNKFREFVTSSTIKKILVTYIHENESVIEPDKYVFSRSVSLDTKMSSSTLNTLLKRIAVKAGVTDVNVQAHTFRHTLVGNLMDAGNSIELVSKFIGHSSVDTTMTYYWLKNISDLSKEIVNPFNDITVTEKEKEEHESDQIEMLNKKIDVCFQIIGLYQSEISNSDNIEKLKDNVKNYNLEIKKVLTQIAYSSNDSSSNYRDFI